MRVQRNILFKKKTNLLIGNNNTLIKVTKLYPPFSHYTIIRLRFYSTKNTKYPNNN